MKQLGTHDIDGRLTLSDFYWHVYEWCSTPSKEVIKISVRLKEGENNIPLSEYPLSRNFEMLYIDGCTNQNCIDYILTLTPFKGSQTS